MVMVMRVVIVVRVARRRGLGKRHGNGNDHHDEPDLDGDVAGQAPAGRIIAGTQPRHQRQLVDRGDQDQQCDEADLAEKERAVGRSPKSAGSSRISHAWVMPAATSAATTTTAIREKRSMTAAVGFACFWRT